MDKYMLSLGLFCVYFVLNITTQVYTKSYKIQNQQVENVKSMIDSVFIPQFPTSTFNQFLLEPVNNSIVITLQPRFSWNPFGNLFYYLQISNGFTSKPILLDTTFFITEFFLEFNTTYYSRVVNTLGSSIGPTSTFTTYNPLIDLYYPEFDYVSTIKPTYLQWNRPKGEITFNIQISKNPNFTSDFVVQEYNYPDSIYHTNWLIKNKLYNWRVQAAYGPIGNTWSDIRTILVLDTILKKVYPDSASSVTDTSITLRWNKLEGTNNYTVRLSNSPQFFNTIVDSSTVLDTFLHVPKLEKNKVYYWTVSSSTDVGEVPSNVWRFTTQTKPQLVEPPNKLANAPKLLTFKWRRQGQLNATSFFQLSDKADFSTVIEQIDGILDTTYFYDGTTTLKQNTTYHWRVRQVIENDTTAWSDTWTFRLPGLPMVTQRYPDSNAIGIPIDTMLHWNPATDVDGYTVRVSTNPNFATTVLEQSPVMNILFTDIKNLEHNRRYYWQTRTRKDGEFGEWSDRWDFLTILAKPNLLLPTNDATISPSEVHFTWQPVNGAESYELKVATDSTFVNPILNEMGVATTTYNYKALMLETTYFWKVKSSSSQNIGQWSMLQKFNTNTINSVGETERIGVTIIPNPVSTVSKIVIHSNGNEQLNSVSIRNILGMVVMTFPMNNETVFTLNANDLPQGMYFLEITTSQKSFVYPLQVVR